MDYNLKNITPDIRKLSDMKTVIYDQKWLKTSPDLDLYYMYRGLEKKGELRYDITVVSAKMLGNEFNKTKGHYHVGAYPELYMVLEGRAIYLLQKKDNEGQIEDVFTVEVKKGECAIMPPFYGHVTINPSATEDLKMANWISDSCKSDYSFYEKMHGACYYYTKDSWIKNENYKSTPELRFEKPLKAIPENLDFLKKA
jgi:glucose-6-phosphate isomerase, archaeal